MKLLTLISEDFYFLSHRRELLFGLRDQGFEVHLATNLRQREGEVRATGLPVYHLDLRRKSLSPISVLKGALACKRLIRQVDPDLVFAVALKPIIVAASCLLVGRSRPLLCAFAGLGVAFTGNSTSRGVRFARWGMERVFRPLLNRPRCHCLFQNWDDADLFLEKRWTIPARTHVITGAGVVLRDFAPKAWDNRGPVEFLFAGRLLWDKGIRELVEACRLLRERGVPFTCRIAGLVDDTNRESVPLAYIQEQHAKGLVDWLGPRSDVPLLMGHADCFVFPSLYREGVPKVLLEASAAGLPMITTDMPGCRDVVRNGKNGILVPAGSIVALADAMEDCVRRRDTLADFGRQARLDAEASYGVDRVIERHVDILVQMAAEAGLRDFVGRPKTP